MGTGRGRVRRRQHHDLSRQLREQQATVGEELDGRWEVEAGARISFWKVSLLATVTLTRVDSVVLLSVSRARAASMWAPFGIARVSQLAAYGTTVSSGP